jgi:hypothetical protein
VRFFLGARQTLFFAPVVTPIRLVVPFAMRYDKEHGKDIPFGMRRSNTHGKHIHLSCILPRRTAKYFSKF